MKYNEISYKDECYIYIFQDLWMNISLQLYVSHTSDTKDVEFSALPRSI